MPVRRTMSKVLLMAAVGPAAGGGRVLERQSRPSPRRRPPRDGNIVVPTGTPITIAYITSLTGEGASQDGTSPAGFTARIDLQNAEGGVDGHKLVATDHRRPDQPHLDHHRRAERGVQGLRHRLAEPTVLPGRQVPATGGRAGDRLLRRRPGVGHPALHEHVRLRQRQREPEATR